jgi:hypothetical protein
MKLNTLLATAVIGLAAGMPAIAQDADSMQGKLDAKLAEEWVGHGGWVLDFDEAKAKAAKENKVILAYFTRSYAF